MNSLAFRSGLWKGFYNYVPGGEKHWMTLELSFESGVIRGRGSDDIGEFYINGSYDVQSGDCSWKKEYISGHTVFYSGFGYENGIIGQWRIKNQHGGFHIWQEDESQV